MDIAVSVADHEFRDEIRTWLRENVPRERQPVEPGPMREFDLAWQRRQYEGGWAGGHNRGFTAVVPEDTVAGSSAEIHEFQIKNIIRLLATVTTTKDVLAALSTSERA
jgi:hypothetical protein